MAVNTCWLNKSEYTIDLILIILLVISKGPFKMNIQNTSTKTPTFGHGAFKRIDFNQKSVINCSSLLAPSTPTKFLTPFSTLLPLPAREETTNSPVSPSKTVTVGESSSEKGTKRKLREKLSNGKWTSEEHRRFLEAMKAYGNSWDLVKEYIGTRTAAQIRSHAQKYYCGMRKREIKKVKGDPKVQRAVFVVTKEYLNTCGMGYRRRIDAGSSTTTNKEKSPTNQASSHQSSSSSGQLELKYPTAGISLTPSNGVIKSVNQDNFHWNLCSEYIK